MLGALVRDVRLLVQLRCGSWKPAYCGRGCHALLCRLGKVRRVGATDATLRNVRDAVAAGRLPTFARDHGFELPPGLPLPPNAPPQREAGATREGDQ